jgi:hypothetical protein
MIGEKLYSRSLKTNFIKENFLMIQKKMIDPGRRRRLPEGFGWIDHCLVRENVIENFSGDALALYLFLLTVGDENGVSWYSDASIRKRLKSLNLTAVSLKNLRDELISGELIAYRKPYYQALELPRPQLANNFRRVLKSAVAGGTDDRTADALPISAIISKLAGGAQ